MEFSRECQFCDDVVFFGEYKYNILKEEYDYFNEFKIMIEKEFYVQQDIFCCMMEMWVVVEKECDEVR